MVHNFHNNGPPKTTRWPHVCLVSHFAINIFLLCYTIHALFLLLNTGQLTNIKQQYNYRPIRSATRRRHFCIIDITKNSLNESNKVNWLLVWT